MTEIRIAEINITNILIILFVGVGGILCIFYNFEQGMSLCFGGLVGYMGRYVQERRVTSGCDDSCDDDNGGIA